MSDTEALTPRERLNHATTILAGLLASGRYFQNSAGNTRVQVAWAVETALTLVDTTARKVGIESE